MAKAIVASLAAVIGVTVAVAAVAAQIPGDDPKISGPVTERPYQQLAVTCFKTGEQISGMNKICYYNCLGSAAAITISSVKLCPLSINQ